MKVVQYYDKYKNDLNRMLLELSDNKNRRLKLQEFISNHSIIYLAIVDDEVVGFASMVIDDFYGLREEIMFVDYMYIDKKFRNGKIGVLLNYYVLSVIEQTDLKMGISFLDGSLSNHFRKRVKGEKFGETLIYKPSDVSNYIDKFKRILS